MKILLSTYIAVTRRIHVYIYIYTWSPNTFTTNITKLQTIQNTTLHVATGCTFDTNFWYLHDKITTTTLLPETVCIINHTKITTPLYKSTPLSYKADIRNRLHSTPANMLHRSKHKNFTFSHNQQNIYTLPQLLRTYMHQWNK